MSDAAHENELIIVRRYEEEEHAHHSSAWKVAHADFMTAMMAFFLIMWLINVTDDQVRKGISQYFNPIHLSTGSVQMKGLNAPSDQNTKKGTKVGHSDTPPNINPVQLTAGGADPVTLTDAQKALLAKAGAAAKGAGAAGQMAGQAAADGGAGPKTGSATAAPGGASAPAPATAGSQAADARERAAFRDPYAILAQLAEKYTLDHPTTVDTVVGDDSPAGVAGGQVDRDPFDPVYWQIQPLPAAKSPSAGKAGTTQAVPPGVTPDVEATAADTAVHPSAATQAAAAPKPPGTDAPTEKVAAATVSPSVAASPPPKAPPATADANAPGKVAAETIAASADVGAKIAKSIKATMAADASPEVSVKATPEGVLINLTDDAAFSMFAVGSAIPDPKVVVLMDRIAKVLAEQKGDVILRGYTDGRPFHSDRYDNWRLSAARAHMAYYMLRRGGLADKRVVAIEGHADRNLKNPADPFAAENRRIEILLKKAGK